MQLYIFAIIQVCNYELGNMPLFGYAITQLCNHVIMQLHNNAIIKEYQKILDRWSCYQIYFIKLSINRRIINKLKVGAVNST
jgi:hypothetical protein